MIFGCGPTDIFCPRILTTHGFLNEATASTLPDCQLVWVDQGISKNRFSFIVFFLMHKGVHSIH